MRVALISFFAFVQASLAGGTGSIADLKWPAVNFLLLSSLLVWKIKKPLKEMFDKNAEDVASLFEIAEKKDKEAQIRLDMYQKKIASLDSEYQRIIDSVDKDTKTYSKKIQKETKDYIERVINDLRSKIAQEKIVLSNEINASLVNEVIRRTKEVINQNDEFKKKATNKLVSQIR